MKLTDVQVEGICKLYRLGKFISYDEIKEGYMNYDFLFKTSKGKFIIQILGGKFDKWKQDSMKLEFAVLSFLRKKNFPYEMPRPIKNVNGDYTSDFGGKKLWTYRFLEGESKDKLNMEEFKQLARATALYHKYIKKFEDKNKKAFSDFDWIIKNYENFRRLRSKNNIDRLMLQNIDFYIGLLRKLERLDYGKFTFIHGDLDGCNVIFERGRLKGMIDFDNIEYAPLAKDIAIIILRENYLGKGWSRRKLDVFLREYKKINSLDKKTRDLIIICALKDYCSLFCWYYNGMKKHRERAYDHMKEALKRTKELLDEARL
jgi:Ser/Thr protein kinase RdoA (MazF antagonist)